MKSKRLILVLSIVVALLLCALLTLYFQGRADPPAPVTAQPQATQAPAPAGTPVPSPEPAPSREAAWREAEAMLPVMDAAVRAIRDDEALFYDAANPQFVWNMLYHLCTGDAARDARISRGPESITVPEAVMEELATSCFVEYTELPAPPEKMKTVQYDPDEKTYTLTLSDAGDTRCEVMDLIAGSGGYTAWVAYLQDEEPALIETYLFELRPNAHLPEDARPLYPLSVLMGYDACNTLARVLSVSGTAEDIQMEIEHVQVIWKEDPADAEVHLSEIQPTGQPNETMRLISMAAVDVRTVYALLEEEEPKDDDPAALFAWFQENYAREVLNGPLIYQMRTYNGVIYSMAPMYGYYFAG